MNLRCLLFLPFLFLAVAIAGDGPFKAPNGKAYPKSWGEPPRIQTSDFGPLPGGYGSGSSTLAGWIQRNLDKDAGAAKPEAPKAPEALGAKEPPKKKSRFPAHWGDPPKRQTRDLRDLPGGYGKGSGTLARWIQKNLDKDAAAAKPAPPKKEPPKTKSRFPAHWGEPPRIQTKDLRKLPGGYGKGSGTLAKWIQRNLDADASVEAGKKEPGGDKALPKEMTVEKAKGLVRRLTNEISEIRDFMSRTRLTPEGRKAQLAEIEKREKEIVELKQWIADH